MSIRDTAEKLHISPHTLKNWIKRENLDPRDIETLSNRGKLNRMANKKLSTRRNIPFEMVRYRRNIGSLYRRVSILDEYPGKIEEKLFLFVIRYLLEKGFIHLVRNPDKPVSIKESLSGAGTYPVLRNELSSYLKYAGISEETQLSPALLHTGYLTKSLMKEPDLPGIIYQALRQEGQRIQAGAYYTPGPVIRELLKSVNYQDAAEIMDPCCGSGLFLCEFASRTGRPESVKGIDRDRTAVFLARINLFCRYPQLLSLSGISHGDALNMQSWNLSSGTVIATNPPWGAHFSRAEKKHLNQRFPQITSGESFSYFILKAIQELPEKGRAAFLLPESILYVKSHRDIRKRILEDAPPKSITHYGPLFRGVYTGVIQITLRKGSQKTKSLVTLKGIKETPLRENQALKAFKNNNFNIMNIHCLNRDREILSKIYSARVRKPEVCRWLLGTVTGDNSRFLSESPEAGTIPVLTGKEIQPFIIKEPRLFLRTDRGSWQQFRDPREYKDSKIVYTFIGNRPSFAVERTGLMTLNSANCLIPADPDLLEPLVGWYNSELFRFIWWKEFRSLKLLRGHLEILPVPLWEKPLTGRITSLVKEGEKGEDIKLRLNQIFFDFFDFTPKEREYVCSEF